MKRILTIIISIICIYANSQPIARFPYYSILQTYWGDSLRTSFDTDTVKWTTNQNYYSIDKPLYIMGNLVGIGGTLIPTVRLNAGDSSAYITTTTGSGVVANEVTNAGSNSVGYLVYNNGRYGLGYDVANNAENSTGFRVNNYLRYSTGIMINDEGDSSTGVMISELGGNSTGTSIDLQGYNSTGVIISEFGGNSTGMSIGINGENSTALNMSINGSNSTGTSIELNDDSSKALDISINGSNSIALDISINGSNATGIDIVSNQVTGIGSAINIDNTGTEAEIVGINITQASWAPSLKITKSSYYGRAVEIYNTGGGDAIIEIYNSVGVKEFQFRSGGYFETTGNITTHGNFTSKGAHIRADIDYTLPHTMTLTENVWQRIDLKDDGDVSNGISLTGDSILCIHPGTINLHFEFNLQNVASKEYEYRIRRNGITLRTIKVTGASANVTRTINYVHKNIGTGYYSIELRSTSASPGNVIFYDGYCYAKMENIW